MITVVTPAAYTNMTTLAIVKAQLDISDTSQDAILEELIEEATAAILSHCNRTFAQETVKETMPAYGNNNLLLSRRPIISVSQIVYNGAAMDPTFWNIEDADAGLVRQDNAPWFSSESLSYDPGLTVVLEGARHLYEVDYVAGYNMPDDPVQTTPLPRDVVRACNLTVKNAYLNRDLDESLVMRQVGPLKVQFTKTGTGISGLSPAADAILQNWVSWALPGG